MLLGDSHRLSTGFGRVNSIAVEAFQAQGWDVAEVAGLTTEPPENEDDGVKTYVPSRGDADPLGLGDIEGAVNDFKPDFLYATCDPGSLTALSTGIPASETVLSYVPIEGEPIVNRNWVAILSGTSFFTCSQYGVRVVKSSIGKDVDWVYHGVNHDVFNPQPRLNGKRDAIRKAFRWEDKFVVMCVSQNVRRKQLPRLIEALAILKYTYKQKDIVLYLHTVPYQGYWLEGWNLPEINQMMGVASDVVFHPNMSKRYASIPDSTDDPTNPGLADLYNAADLFVLPSQVEGFGLPIAEAMASGVPVLVTQYGAGYEIASGAGKGLTYTDVEIHKSGTRYANVSVQDMAKDILKLKRSPNELARMSKAGIVKAQSFQWTAFQDMLIRESENIVGNKERNITNQA